eukprot:6069900-Pyramimonas_sp.AAC.1
MSRTRIHDQTTPTDTDTCQHFSVIRHAIRQLQSAVQHRRWTSRCIMTTMLRKLATLVWECSRRARMCE